jgi:integrase
MGLTDAKIKALKPRVARYLVSDGDGLNIEVLPSGSRSWIFRYRLHGRPEKVALGRYPETSLKRAREERFRCARLVADGKSPARVKKLERQKTTEQMTVREFGERYFIKEIEKRWKDPSNIRRWLTKDIYPWLGEKHVKAVTPADVQTVIYRKRDHGMEVSAAKIRGVLKALFDYAIERQVGALEVNPARTLRPFRFTRPRSRDRKLDPKEIRKYLHTIYRSNMRRQFKLAFHLLLLTMVRKSELLFAEWEEMDFETSEWEIPGERTKNGKPHIVYLSRQALEIFGELKVLASGSKLVLPGRSSLAKPFSRDALNKALEGLEFGIPAFTIHDMRRTASTLLNEKGFAGDVIEKALNHTLGGVRGIYNKAQYAEQRREMLQYWADLVESLISEEKIIRLPLRTTHTA